MHALSAHPRMSLKTREMFVVDATPASSASPQIIENRAALVKDAQTKSKTKNTATTGQMPLFLTTCR
jgi:hypothetical protein